MSSWPTLDRKSTRSLRAPEEEWTKFWSRRPPPGSNDLMALIKRRVLKAEGDLHVFMANLRSEEHTISARPGRGVDKILEPPAAARLERPDGADQAARAQGRRRPSCLHGQP